MEFDKQPIIVGVGQQTWRDRNAERTPVDALQAVATAALSDTGSEKVLGAVDSVVQVPFLLTQVPELAPAMPVNTGAVLAERLGISARQYSAVTGGNLPQQLLSLFAGRLVRGESDVVLLCGVELLASFLGALRSGEGFPDWATGREDVPEVVVPHTHMTAASEDAHGLFEPINTYPLFESALRHASGLDGPAHGKRLGTLVASMSEVAARNPLAWKNRRYTAAEVLSTEGGNRLICHPYTKLMNAIAAVDQAAAVVLTTVGRARALGLDPDRWIYLRGAANAGESWFLSQREELHRSPTLAAAAQSALAQSGLGLEAMTHFDVYSCFPAAVQIACAALGLAIDDPRGVTVTGGMTLFGGPGNNYSLHAIAQMTDELRETDRGAGLISANGGYLTKHAVGVYARDPGKTPWVPADEAPLQQKIDAIKTLPVIDAGEGSCTIEAHTVRYQAAEPDSGIVILRLPDDSRCVAIVDAGESDVITRLLAEDCVGAKGRVQHRDGLNYFCF
jgi:acetyl-CoA C-acetyltransferase